MTFLEQVAQAFQAAKLPYALVGGHAVALHGAVRGTVDIDFVLKWSRNALIKAEKVLAELGLVSRLPISAADVFDFREEYIKNRNLIAWNFYHPEDLSKQVDLIINYDLSGKRVTAMPLGNTNIKVLAISDLIDMKRAAGRAQDVADVAALERIAK
ncbi:MAG: hypothetical protein HKN50_11970 [Gammaproteobacteria bacterium]|nr:hypothetical protein [Gammaproteobacteria bacterium]